MPRKRIVRYTVPMNLFDGIQREGLLDMMRYDRAVVVDWSHDREDGVLTLQSELLTEGRWQSFGIHPQVILDEYAS